MVLAISKSKDNIKKNNSKISITAHKSFKSTKKKQNVENRKKA